jgi:D-arabinose 1-dehydrogenase-like Zn-dependent alcohol dehydrogenase
MKMKAWTLDTPALITERPLHLREVPVPSPAEDEVLLRVNACGICRTDLHVVEGELASARGAEVYVCTRDQERHQSLARELGATWVGDAKDEPPVKLHASSISRRQVNLFRLRSR